MFVIERNLIAPLATDEAAFTLDNVSNEPFNGKDDYSAVVSNCGTVFSDEHRSDPEGQCSA
jgi:hypothetical protein